VPHPLKGEKRQDYISRCMGDEEMRRKHSDPAQRAAVCYAFWRGKHGGSPPPAKGK
jgi:hypothetical protein